MVVRKNSTTLMLSLPKTSSVVTECDSCASGRRNVYVSDQAAARRTIPHDGAGLDRDSKWRDLPDPYGDVEGRAHQVLE